MSDDAMTITEADVESFRGKLDEWGSGLADGEKAILRSILVRAFPEDDVSGFILIGLNQPKSAAVPQAGPLGIPQAGPLGLHVNAGKLIGQPYLTGGLLPTIGDGSV